MTIATRQKTRNTRVNSLIRFTSPQTPPLRAGVFVLVGEESPRLSAVRLLTSLLYLMRYSYVNGFQGRFTGEREEFSRNENAPSRGAGCYGFGFLWARPGGLAYGSLGVLCDMPKR